MVEFLDKCGEKYDYVNEHCLNGSLEKELGISSLDFFRILKDSDEEIPNQELEKVNAQKLRDSDYLRLSIAAEKFG